MFTHYRVHLSPGYDPRNYIDIVAVSYNERSNWIDFFQKDGSKTDSFSTQIVVRIQQINKVPNVQEVVSA